MKTLTNLFNRRKFLKVASRTGIGALCGLSVISNPGCQSSREVEPEMPKRLLGRTKLPVSLLGFGCTQVKDKSVYQRAIESGVSYFHLGDRDPAYNLEACAALQPLQKQIVVAYMSHPKKSRQELLADLDGFLQQSKMGYLDVWFVITPSPEVLSEFREAATVAQTAGKIRWTGMTTHNLDRDVPVLTAPDYFIDVVMLVYNFTSPPAHQEALERLHAAGCGITPMKPLAGRFYEVSASKPDALLRWLAADSRIHTIPVIMQTVEQVEQNVAALKQPFSNEDLNTLQSLFAFTSARFCRLCGACSGQCRHNLAVSDLVRVAMYAEGYRDLNRARVHFTAIPPAQRQFVCDDCESCTVHCPNGVAIRERIRCARDLVV